MTDGDPLSWEERWTRPDRRSYPSASVEALIAELWPDDAYSDVFQVKAGYLLAALEEDGRPLPGRQEDALVRELTEMVLADLRNAGLPDH